MKLVKTLLVMMSALFLHANAQAGILIDDFSTFQGPLRDNVVGPGAGTDNGTPNTNYHQTNSFGGDIVGSYRDIYVEDIDTGLEGVEDDDTIGIYAYASSGRLSITLENLVKGIAAVTYDGMNEVGNDWAGNVDVDGLAENGVGLDWSGTDYFLFEDVNSDFFTPLQLIVWTDDANNGTFVRHVADFYSLDGSVLLYDIPTYLDEFEGDNINWSSVGAFQLVFNLDSNGGSILDTDLSLSSIALVPVSVPEPLSMFGAGILMLGFVRVSRRKKQWKQS